MSVPTKPNPLAAMAASVAAMRKAAADLPEMPPPANEAVARQGAANVLTSSIGNTALGAGVGALAGGVGGAMMGDKEHRIRNAILGVLAGGAVGGIGTAGHEVNELPRNTMREAVRLTPGSEKEITPDRINQVPGGFSLLLSELMRKGGSLADMPEPLVLALEKMAFVPSPQTQAAMEQQVAQQASDQAKAQGQGAPPAMRMEDLAQMMDQGFQQIGQGVSQILAMLQSGQLVMQMMQQAQAGPAPVSPQGGPAAPQGGGDSGGGEGGGEKKEKKSEGGGDSGGGGGGGAPAAPAGGGGGNVEQRLSNIEQMLQQLAGGGAAPAGGPPPPAPMGGMPAPGGAPAPGGMAPPPGGAPM